jgi:hypothetical protein
MKKTSSQKFLKQNYDVFDEVTDPEKVDLKKTDQIVVTVSDRAGQTFEPDMAESGQTEIFFITKILLKVALNTIS